MTKLILVVRVYLVSDISEAQVQHIKVEMLARLYTFFSLTHFIVNYL